MNIEYISIENFKCFEKIELSFDKKFNVLIGDNATGKTSVLDAISFALGTFLIGVRKATQDSMVELRPLKSDEKRRVLTENSVLHKLPFKLTLEHRCAGKHFKWTRSSDKVTGGSTTYKEANELILYAQELCRGIYDENDKTNLPLIAYYGTERLFNEKHQRKPHLKKTSRAEGYAAALDPRSLEERFITWFADYEDAVLKFGKDKGLYDAFTNAISTMVPDWQEIRFSWKHKAILGRMKDGTWSSFDMMSSGYKSIVRLAGDIAYRAIKLNPHLGKNAVLETEGVVLIDELDMHIHPSWQRKIISLLNDAFPKIQFIATTHSPFIIQSIGTGKIVKLMDFSLDSVSGNVSLKGLEDIAEDEMDINLPQRSEHYIEYFNLAAEYFSLLKNDDIRSNKVKEKLQNIELKFKDDPVLAALLKIERKSVEGRSHEAN